MRHTDIVELEERTSLASYWPVTFADFLIFMLIFHCKDLMIRWKFSQIHQLTAIHRIFIVLKPQLTAEWSKKPETHSGSAKTTERISGREALHHLKVFVAFKATDWCNRGCKSAEKKHWAISGIIQYKSSLVHKIFLEFHNKTQLAETAAPSQMCNSVNYRSQCAKCCFCETPEMFCGPETFHNHRVNACST